MSIWVVSFFSLFSLLAWSQQTVKVPAGEIEAFWLTTSDSKSPQAKVQKIKVEELEVMVHAVRVKDFKKFLLSEPKWKKESVKKIFADASYLSNFADIKDSPAIPITYVSWFAARAYCESKSMRLPSIAEWEYLAAASETKPDANKEEKFLRRILDWYGEPNHGQKRPVKSVYKNMYGLWDMHGLVWEWVEDFNSSFVSGESREDSSFNKNLFCGGGSMTSSDKENYAAFMRFAFRSSLKANASVWNLGFRCVR